MICNIQDPLTKEDYTRDPRNVARKAVNYMKSTGIADTAYFGPELEFFVFDDVRYDQTPALRLLLPRQRRGRLEHRPRREARTSATSCATRKATSPARRPTPLHDLRSEMMLTMIECGLKVEAQHHEVATGGQGEIDMQYAPLVEMADNVLKYKYIVKNVARKHGKTATFMPKPLFMDNGTRHARPHVAVEGRQEPVRRLRLRRPVATSAMYAIGGLLRHAPALCAITNPTTNSYKRLVPGYEAPVNLAYSRRNRSASIRIPVYSPQPQGQAARVPLPRRLEQPVPRLRGHADGHARRHQEQDQARRAARQGHLRPGAGGAGQGAQDARLAGGGAGQPGEATTSSCCRATCSRSDVISTWIWYKREKEVDAIRLRPHPYEFALYFDI